jgi:hypothetical protein
MPERSKDPRISRNDHHLSHEDTIKLLHGTREYIPDDTANLKARIADQKQVIISLRAQLAEMRERMDRWQSRADRITLTASY